VRQRIELASQPRPASLVGDDDRMEAFDGDLVARLRVERAPDLRRAAGSDGLQQAIPGEEHGPSQGSTVANGALRATQAAPRGRCSSATKPPWPCVVVPIVTARHALPDHLA